MHSELKALGCLSSRACCFNRDLKGSFKGDIDIDVDVEVDVDINSYCGCLTGVSKLVQVLFDSSGTVRWYGSSSGTDFDISEIASREFWGECCPFLRPFETVEGPLKRSYRPSNYLQLESYAPCLVTIERWVVGRSWLGSKVFVVTVCLQRGRS